MGDRIQVLGCGVDSVTIDDVFSEFDRMIASHAAHQVTFVNANKLWLATRDAELSRIIHQSALVLPEWSVYWASNVLGTPLRGYVLGIVLAQMVFERAARIGHRLFLVGAAPGVLERIVETASFRWPGLLIVGHHDGYFTDSTLVHQEIRAARPDILLVGMGSPRQELWIASSLEAMAVPVSIGVGGSFDVIAGVRPDAPAWARGHGLEWAWRLAQNPRNLWKRYLVTNPWFVWRLLRARILQR